jgi:hypothetical protein
LKNLSIRHEENLSGKRKVAKKSDRGEFGEVRHGRKRSKPVIDKTKHELKLVDLENKPRNHEGLAEA